MGEVRWPQEGDGRRRPAEGPVINHLSRDGEWSFPRLAGVLTTPTLKPDGTILSEPGYDSATQLLLLDSPAMPGLSQHPTLQEAGAALAMLDGLVDEFPFVD